MRICMTTLCRRFTVRYVTQVLADCFISLKQKKLPYSIDDVRKVVNQYSICAEIKPTFYKPPLAQVIKATQPFERLSLNFKGPMPTATKNHYMWFSYAQCKYSLMCVM